MTAQMRAWSLKIQCRLVHSHSRDRGIFNTDRPYLILLSNILNAAEGIKSVAFESPLRASVISLVYIR